MDNRVRILIADGNEEFCEHLKKALEQISGYEVVGVASDGAQAVELLTARQPDVLVLDLMPALRALAKTFAADPAREAFLQALPHRYYEENNLHGLLVCGLKDYPAAAAALDAFLPFVDNWATCDLLRPRAFAKHPPELPDKLRAWLASGRTYTVRFGLGMLMSFYLDGEFRPEYLELAASVRSDEYYVNMNDKEIGELRRRLRPDRTNITAVRGCYVSESREILSAFRQPFGLMITRTARAMTLIHLVSTSSPKKRSR